LELLFGNGLRMMKIVGFVEWHLRLAVLIAVSLAMIVH
jgi:hypothetical protein